MRAWAGVTGWIAVVASACTLGHPQTVTQPDADTGVVTAEASVDAPGPDVFDASQPDDGAPPDMGVFDEPDVVVRVDTGPADTGPVDTGPVDMGVPDAGVTYTLDPGGAGSLSSTYGTTTDSGNRQSMHCNDDEVMVGATGWNGTSTTSTMNALGIYCAVLASDGTVGTSRLIPIQGYTTGNNFDASCDTSMGQMVVGAAGRSGSLDDQLGFTCGTLAGWLATPSTTTGTLGPWGGTGGSAFSAPCPSGQVMHGVDFDNPQAGGHARVSNLSFQCIPVNVTP